MNRDKFFPSIRASLFANSLQPTQFEGLNALLAAAPGEWDNRWLAYGLATAYHETAFTMEPIAEYGHGAGHTYGNPDPVTGLRYYGRGYVQLTWKANYQHMSAIVGTDLVANPELALQPAIAAKVLFFGMEHGSFTGKKLADYFNDNETDWANARRIINSTDRASQIASYALKFFTALQE
jgi:predicted chitinase